jgi:hypothetical protein
MVNRIQIIDNFIDVEYQEKIKELLFGDQFPWYYTVDVTYGKGIDQQYRAPACKHGFVEQGNMNSAFFDLFIPLAQKACVMKNATTVMQARTFMQFPLSKSFVDRPVDKMHVDSKKKHTVLLYYVCDSDGDTIIVDKEYEDGEIEKLDYQDYKLLHKVTPKQGRAVIFDGSYYHTAEQPSSNMRCVLNFNLF